MLGFHLKKKKEERKGLNYNTLCKSFPLCYFSLINVFVVFEQVCCCHGLRRSQSPAICRSDDGRAGFYA